MKIKKINYLKPDEIEDIIDFIPNSDSRDIAIFRTLFQTGIKVSELINIKKNNLDLNSQNEVITINIENTYNRNPRKVYIDQTTLKSLNKMIYKRTRKNKKDKNSYLFHNRYGMQMTPNSIQQAIKKHSKIADKKLSEFGIKTKYEDYLSPEIFRHSFAIDLIHFKKCPVKKVQKLLGHKNISNTKFYLNIDL